MKTKKTTTQGWFIPDPEKHKNMFLSENKKDEEIKSLIKSTETKHILAEHLAAIRHSYYKTKSECYNDLKDKIPKGRTNFYRLIRHGEISSFLKGEGITPIPTRPYIYRLLEKVPKEHLIPLWESVCKAAHNASNLKQNELIEYIDTYNTSQKTNINISAEKREQKIQGKKRYVCAVFAKQYINEVADILLSDYNAEVALVINPNTNHVSYRRTKDSKVDLSELATKLADGAGHEYSSGSKITEKFMLFTKVLKKI